MNWILVMSAMAMFHQVSNLYPVVTTQQLTYSKTSVGAWLCDTSTTTMNNTSAQGYLFYKHVSTGLQHYTVNAIYSCQGAEGVGGGNTKGDLSGDSGLVAIEKDMKDLVKGCVKH